MFCSNCGSELAPGAKFCSECGTKVETVVASDAKVEEPIKAESAFADRVSFDWSNVIDEPQKKEVPQGIKSPWASTTDGISERELYSEMTQTDDKNRTMDFIDILKADKEERERAALDKSIEYTEVLEIDPELTGGTKPPKMHYAPLYDDVDEPVKTPFDDIAEPEMESTAAYVAPIIDIPEEEKIEETVEVAPKAAPKFEIPDFLKKAVGFGAAGKDEPERIEKPVVEEPVFEEAEEQVEEEPVFEAPAEPVAIEESADPITDEPAIETPEIPVQEEIEEIVVNEEPSEKETEDIYLDEDLYLDIEENKSATGRMSRVDANTIAGIYDEEDLEEDEEDEEDEVTEEAAEIEEEPEAESIDEEELFTEMAETPAGHTGMTIAAPADEEEEIEALKRRLAELTGALDMSSVNAEMSEADEVKAGPAATADVEDEYQVSPEPEFDDFKFEPEVTAADDELFAGLTPASEVPAETTSAGLSIEDEYLTSEPAVTEEIKAVTEEIKTEEPAAEVKSFGLTDEDVPAASEPAYEEPPVGKLEFEAPAPTISDDQKEAFNNLVFDFPQADETPADDSPIAGFAPAVTEAAELETAAAPEPVVIEAPEQPADDTPRGLMLDDFAVETPKTAEPEQPAVPAAEPVQVIKETPVSMGLEPQPKASDAVSLEDLEKDLFGEVPDDSEPETTKKIDKFYTLYRKNEEFQRLLDEEYSRLKGDNVQIPGEEVVDTPASSVAMSLDDFAKDIAPEIKEAPVEPALEAVAPAVKTESEATAAVLEEITENSRPVEDATIYRVDMPQEQVELVSKAEENSGFSVGTGETSGEIKFGLDGNEAVAAGAAAVAGAAGAVAAAGAAGDKAAKKAAKKAEREAKKAAKKAQKAAEAADPQVEYENVDSGSTILTILAVLVAILLVVLLVIILILHLAPDSGIAMKIDEIIEGITGGFSAIHNMGGIKWL